MNLMTLALGSMPTPKRVPRRATVYFDPAVHKALRLKAAETEQQMG